MSARDVEEGALPVRVWISYAHTSKPSKSQVRRLWDFLRSVGIDARLDLSDAERPQNWPEWIMRQVRAADYILIIASSDYRRRSEGAASADEGRGVQFEAQILRTEFYTNQEAARLRFLPVVLPGATAADIPVWIGGPAATYYKVSSLTLRGAGKLLRYLTGQPYEVERELGHVPVLTTRRSTAAASVPVRRSRAATTGKRFSFAKNEITLQAQIRQLLERGDIGLDDYDLGLDAENQQIESRRIDIRRASIVIEVRADLRHDGIKGELESELALYIAKKREATGQPYSVLLTNGRDWQLYSGASNPPALIDRWATNPERPDVRGLLKWLEAILATAKRVPPTPQQIDTKLGATSPAYQLNFAELRRLYEENRQNPSVDVKRRLWSKLLTTASGINFNNEDDLFVNHTLLVIMAEVIGHAVVGIDLRSAGVSAAEMLSGSRFASSDVRGVIEPDFFDWVAEVPGGENFVKDLARRLARFDWSDVRHDLLKLLYESIIDHDTRKQLGEFYTPDWLAEKVIEEQLNNPLSQRVLDASCGSGTFLFYAVRAYLAAAEKAGISAQSAVKKVTSHVLGIDVHPVAVTLARVTYLLAIGMQRIATKGAGAITIPVYLGDSLHWSEEYDLLSHTELTVSTSDDEEIFADPLVSPDESLSFPDHVVADATRFDQLVNELADLATLPALAPLDALGEVFERNEVIDEDRPGLVRTFNRMRNLHAEGRDHIWAYYVRNLARPFWLSRSGNRVDVLVGNPPWLPYGKMTGTQQVAFRAMCRNRGLWGSASVATTQDLSALFAVRCIELYLREGGSFCFVMPWAALYKKQYAGFRLGVYPIKAEPMKVAFRPPWDLHGVKPDFFPLPSSVIMGERVNFGASATPIGQATEIWTGRVEATVTSWAEAAPHIERRPGESPVHSSSSSPYRSRFFQGATFVPQFLFVVEPDDESSLGPGFGRLAVRSRRSVHEKKPWKGLPRQYGQVEAKFVRPLYVGASVMPFRCLETVKVITPIEDGHLLHVGDRRLYRHRGLAKWWSDAESIWDAHRASERLELIQRVDYHKGLSKQFPVSPYRVVYNKSGVYLAASVVYDQNAVIDQQLYWCAVRSVDEARYLSAIFNSSVVPGEIRHLQARGEHNPRHFDKLPLDLPIPAFMSNSPLHQELVTLATACEQAASAVPLPSVKFELKRQMIRNTLENQGLTGAIDGIVKDLLKGA
jgi:SAM-dependent methyltransferase